MASGIFRAFANGSVYFEVRWNQLVLPSSSKLAYELYLRTTQYGAVLNGANKTVKISANGHSITHEVDLTIGTSTDKLLGTGVLGPIYHNSDGTCAVDLSLESEIGAGSVAGADGIEVNWVRDSETIYFDPILIAAFIGGTSKITDGQSFTIAYSNMALDVSAVQLYMYIKSNNALITTKNLNAATATSTSGTVTLTSAEHTQIRNYSANAIAVPLTLKLKTTFENGSEIWSPAFTANWYVANTTVSLSPTVEVTDGLSLDLTGSTTKIIKGVSDVTYAFNATASPGASIAKYQLQLLGVNHIFTSATGNITDVTSQHFTFKVFDSRGAGNYEEVITPFVDYVPVSCTIEANATVFNSATAVTIPLVISGQYFNGSFGARNNIIDLQYRYKINSGSFSSWTRITPTLSGNTYKATANISTTYDAEVTVEAQVLDQITSTTTTYKSSVQPVFDWGAEDFSFNVPVTFNNGFSTTSSVNFSNGLLVNGYAPLCVVAQGESGIWTYRKYSDGTSECWGTLRIANLNITSAWLNVYTSGKITESSSWNFPSGLFSKTPICNISLNGEYAGAWVTRSGSSATPTSTTHPGSFEILRGAPLAGSAYVVCFYARGVWN